MVGYLIVGVIISVFLLVFFLIYKFSRKRINNMKEIKKRLSLDGESGTFFKNANLQGEYNGRRLSIWQETHSSGSGENSSQTTYTYIDLGVDNGINLFYFSLTPDVTNILNKIKFVPKFLKNAAQKVKSKMNIQDISIGNKEFDDKWIISSNDEEKIVSLLDYSTCERIENFNKNLCSKKWISNNFSLKLDGEGLHFFIQTDLNDPDCVCKIVSELDILGNDIESLVRE